MLKAIDTIYRGNKFRSRLEARWAVFFHSLGIKYEYEKEGFAFDKKTVDYYQLDSGAYLPDFWLSDYKYWVEIKPESPSIDELNKLMALCQQSGFPALIFLGLPGESAGVGFAFSTACFHAGINEWKQCFWYTCNVCGKTDISPINDDFEVLSFNGTRVGLCYCRDANKRNLHSACLSDAYMKAKQARFEFKNESNPLDKETVRLIEEAKDAVAKIILTRNLTEKRRNLVHESFDKLCEMLKPEEE